MAESEHVAGIRNNHFGRVRDSVQHLLCSMPADEPIVRRRHDESGYVDITQGIDIVGIECCFRSSDIASKRRVVEK